jgi:Ca2+-binding RTX toxin-like protein
VLDGGTGNDTVSYAGDTAGVVVDISEPVGSGSGSVVGSDTIRNMENITTGSGNDVVTGSDLANRISTGTGADFVTAGGGNDTIFGGAGNDVLSGGAGNDTISGEGDNDILQGGGGNDTLDGGAGADSLQGGSGNDTLIVDSTDTLKSGGVGVDTLRVSTATSGGVTADLAAGGIERAVGGAFGDTFTNVGSTVAVNIDGQAGNDTLTGGGGADTINGGGDADTVSGAAGADKLFGGEGTDRIIGGAGNDTLTGGASGDFGDGQADTFVFSAGWGKDVIRDFEDGIALERIEFNGFGAVDFTDLLITSSAAGAVVKFIGGTDQITLTGVSAASLGVDDFLFT